jgi:tetratricopeptide (TPR) repeat protein
MRLKQIIVIVIVMAIAGYLSQLPVKGLTKHAEGGRGKSAESQSAPPAVMANVTVDIVSAPAKAAIGTALAARITDLEGQLKNAPDADKLNLQKQLAKQWDDDNQPAPAAFYYLAAARKENSFEDWASAGSHFNDAYKTTQDTTLQPAFVANAIEAFKNAAKLKPENLDAKTGLGVAYVNQTSSGIADPDGGSPMQGIMLLLDVVKSDPNNRNANLNLGLFAMKSGQFEKAVARFKTVIAQKPEVEPYFYLAESYKQLGMKKEAIEAYQKCKGMITDPIIGQKMDQYIKELKN